MNIIQIQDRLKDFSEQQLVNEMQRPTGSAPQYLVLSELERRQKVKQSFESQQGSEPSVAEEAVMSRMMPAQMTARAGMGLPNAAQQPMRMFTGGQLDQVVQGIGLTESNLDPMATGEAGEIGAYQIFGENAINYGFGIPSLAPDLQKAVSQGRYSSFKEAYMDNKELIDEKLRDPEISKSLAKDIIKTNYDLFRDEYPDAPENEIQARAIAAYNLGTQGARKLENPLQFGYVQRVASNLQEQESDVPQIFSVAQAATPGQPDERRVVGTNRAGIPIYSGGPESPEPDIKRGRSQSVENFASDPVTGMAEGADRKSRREALAAQKEAERKLKEPVVTPPFLPEAGQVPASENVFTQAIQQAEQQAEQQAAKTTQADEDPETNLYDKLRQLAEDRVTAAEEDAEFNKFLALAQMGAALAQSDRGFVGAIGEGIEAGLPTLAATRKPLREAQEGILDTEIDIAKLQADLGKKGELTVDQRLRLSNQINDDILNNQKEIQDIQQDPLGDKSDIARLQQEIRQLQLARANLSAGLYSVPSQQDDPLNTLSVEAIDQVLQSRGTQ